MTVSTSTTSHTSTYAFDQAWQQELERLRSIEATFDPASRRNLAKLGVAQGWRCLEVGCGAGSLALWLADRVGPSGRVLAIDLDPRFLEAHDRANLDVRRLDVVNDPLEPASFDLVHARAVLMHIPERDHVLARLLAATRPGGWVVIEDVDFGEPFAAMSARYLVPPDEAAFSQKIWRAVEAAFVALGADPSFGAKVPAALVEAGLEDVGAELHAPMMCGGPRGDWITLSLQHLRPRMVQSGLVAPGEVERYLKVLAHPLARYLPPLLTTAWGRRPTAA